MLVPMRVFANRAKGGPGRPPGTTASFFSGGVPVPIVNISDAMEAREAMAHPVVRRAVMIIAEASSQIDFVVEPVARVPQDTVASIRAALDEPTPDMTGDQLVHWLALNLALYGRAAVKIDLSSIRPFIVSAIYPIETDSVKAIRDDRGNTVRYEVGSGSQVQTFPSYWSWKLMEDAPGRPLHFVYEFWRPTLSGFRNSQEANTPLASIGLPSRIIKALMARALNTAEGHPNSRYLLYTGTTLTSEHTDALKKYVNDSHGISGELSGKAMLLDSLPDLNMIKLDNDLADIHSKTPIDDMTRMIFGAFRIPVALAGLGAADASKYAQNYRESRATFWEDAILPGYIKPISRGLKQCLGNRTVNIYPDLETVPSMIEGRSFAMAAVDQVRFLTPNEKRMMFGKPGREDGDMLETSEGKNAGVSNQVLS